MLSKEEEYVKMRSAEEKLWWYRILHGQVLETIQNKFSSKEIKILDAGCGTGGLLYFLKAAGYSNIEGFDVSEYAVNACNERNVCDVKKMSVQELSTYYVAENFDLITCNDMLYFVEDEEWPQILRAIFALLKPNGLLIINLPAFNVFQGTHDLSVGIRNRWTYRRFFQQLKSAKVEYRTVNYLYWPVIVSPLILAVRLFQKIKIKLGLIKNVQSDVRVPSKRINNILYKITKLESYLPLKRVFGSSLFISVHK